MDKRREGTLLFILFSKVLISKILDVSFFCVAEMCGEGKINNF
jgi:hypothetical protein